MTFFEELTFNMYIFTQMNDKDQNKYFHESRYTINSMKFKLALTGYPLTLTFIGHTFLSWQRVFFGLVWYFLSSSWQSGTGLFKSWSLVTMSTMDTLDTLVEAARGWYLFPPTEEQKRVEKVIFRTSCFPKLFKNKTFLVEM